MHLIKWLKSLFRRTDLAMDLIQRIPRHYAFTETMKERQALAPGATIGGSVNNSSILTSALNMGVIRRARCLLFVGAIPGGGNVNFSLQAFDI